MQIDIAKLAFDASKEHPEFPDDAETPTGDELAVFQRFAAFVLEAAAVQCEQYAIDKWALYKGSKPYTGSEPGRASHYAQGQSDGADYCADAIRAM